MKNSINESFVDELLKSGVWDIARVGRGSREENVIEEGAEASSEEEISARQLAEELLMNLDEDIILEFIDLVYQSTLNEDSDEEEYEEYEEESEIDEATKKKKKKKKTATEGEEMHDQVERVRRREHRGDPKDYKPATDPSWQKDAD